MSFFREMLSRFARRRIRKGSGDVTFGLLFILRIVRSLNFGPYFIFEIIFGKSRTRPKTTLDFECKLISLWNKNRFNDDIEIQSSSMSDPTFFRH